MLVDMMGWGGRWVSLHKGAWGWRAEGPQLRSPGSIWGLWEELAAGWSRRALCEPCPSWCSWEGGQRRRL